MFHNIFYYLTLFGMMCYSVIDFCNGNAFRVCVWLTISAVLILAHELSHRKCAFYQNCTFITTADNNSETKQE